MKSQLIRAAESIASNIVEGAAAATPREFARYLDIGIKSASETEYRLQLAKDHRVLPNSSWAMLTQEVVEIRKMLFGLRRAVLAADSEDRDAEKDRGQQQAPPRKRGRRRSRKPQPQPPPDNPPITTGD